MGRPASSQIYPKTPPLPPYVIQNHFPYCRGSPTQRFTTRSSALFNQTRAKLERTPSTSSRSILRYHSPTHSRILVESIHTWFLHLTLLSRPPSLCLPQRQRTPVVCPHTTSPSPCRTRRRKASAAPTRTAPCRPTRKMLPRVTTRAWPRRPSRRVGSPETVSMPNPSKSGSMGAGLSS